MHESHLWAYFLSQGGVVSLKARVYFVMVVSTGLILLGFTLLAVGPEQIEHGIRFIPMRLHLGKTDDG